jgi:hypothetical protein
MPSNREELIQNIQSDTGIKAGTQRLRHHQNDDVANQKRFGPLFANSVAGTTFIVYRGNAMATEMNEAAT